MSRSKLVGACALAILALAARNPLAAQEQDKDEKPKPAARALPPLDDLTNSQDSSSDQGTHLKQDDGPVTGVQRPTLGTPEMRHSYWVPGIQYSNTIRSNSLTPTTNGGWNSTSYVAGNLSLMNGWRRARLSLNYSGGGYFPTDSTEKNGQFHQLALGYQLQGRRWQMLMMDQFSYLPESAFGFGGSTGLSDPGVGGGLVASVPGLQGGFVPGQNTYATVGPRYSNSSALQLTYQTSERGSVTVAGVYGVLRFIDSGNIESNYPSATVGYNYAISRNDSVGLTYRFSAYQFLQNPQALGDHSAQVVYGRKITGRMALQLSGGPDITTFRVPINNETQKISASGAATLTYGFERGGVSLNYSHGTSGGSGVLVGSTADQVGVTANRQLSRVWQANIGFSYSRNQVIASQTGLSTPTFDTWYANSSLSRALGRDASFSIGYQAQNQTTGLSSCAGTNCNASYIIHQITLSFQWHTRPFVLR